ncbi:nucleotide exchange factor GrpE [Pacificimonas flava]|uniref:Protein GrpE n=2 Tax=Pacificimonas TaxID=1960290 RepID=A0A219B178_9SPHN|nr:MULTISPECIES: nucleotide exchange factor GrpE [Pacificimonas]MBZ6379660.1 nucleotide exchange factor GrpE [Pacificimonas aurantium]OWV31876.1 nucleotide exchange factor GrpE [Pacificimonas flava]
MTTENAHNDDKNTEPERTEPDFSSAEAELAEAEAEAAAGETHDAEQDQRLTDLESEVATLKDRLMRAVAETENVRRRLEREKEDSSSYAITGFARDLLSVADNLTRALDAAEKDEVVNKGLLTGVEMTQKELMKAFEKHGISRVESVGQPLDPHTHQAMMEVEADEEHAAGTIVQELQPGYKIKDRLLRPAMVSVAK